MYDAVSTFSEALGIARELLSIDTKHYRDPPKSEEYRAVEGLQAGTAVLMVAAFEAFLNDLMEEAVSDLASKIKPNKYSKLPPKIRVQNVFSSLDRAVRGPAFQNTTKEDRLPDLIDVCIKIGKNELLPTAFNSNNSNPNPDAVKEVLKGVGISNPFQKLKSRFEKKSYWGMPVAATFIRDRLELIVNRRHSVAHTGRISGFSRAQLREDIKFIRILGRVLDMEVREQVRTLARECR